MSYCKIYDNNENNIQYIRKRNLFIQKKLNEIKNTKQVGIAYFYVSLKKLTMFSLS